MQGSEISAPAEPRGAKPLLDSCLNVKYDPPFLAGSSWKPQLLADVASQSDPLNPKPIPASFQLNMQMSLDSPAAIRREISEACRATPRLKSAPEDVPARESLCCKGYEMVGPGDVLCTIYIVLSVGVLRWSLRTDAFDAPGASSKPQSRVCRNKQRVLS